jgi:hypothetical protein
MCFKNIFELYCQADFLKNSNLRARRMRHFFQNHSGNFFLNYYYESKKPSGDQIREMVTTGFGLFHMESLKRSTNKVETLRIPQECVHKPGGGGGYVSVTFSIIMNF